MASLIDSRRLGPAETRLLLRMAQGCRWYLTSDELDRPLGTPAALATQAAVQLANHRADGGSRTTIAQRLAVFRAVTLPDDLQPENIRFMANADGSVCMDFYLLQRPGRPDWQLVDAHLTPLPDELVQGAQEATRAARQAVNSPRLPTLRDLVDSGLIEIESEPPSVAATMP